MYKNINTALSIHHKKKINAIITRKLHGNGNGTPGSHRHNTSC